MHKILGGNPLTVAFRLVVLSIVVGMVLAFLGLSPFELFDYVRVFFLRIYHMGFAAFGWVGQYFLIGAIIVIILLAAFPLAWGLSLLLHHDGTYGPSVLLAIGIGLADAAFRPT